MPEVQINPGLFSPFFKSSTDVTLRRSAAFSCKLTVEPIWTKRKPVQHIDENTRSLAIKLRGPSVDVEKAWRGRQEAERGSQMKEMN
jgi:hypothetical protein